MPIQVNCLRQIEPPQYDPENAESEWRKQLLRQFDQNASAVDALIAAAKAWRYVDVRSKTSEELDKVVSDQLPL